MKKSILKLKIIMTNISRIIMSFLFINLGSLFQNSVQATIEPTCYIAGPTEKVNSFNLEKVFIIAVPIALLVSFIIIKIKKSKKKKRDKGE